MSTLPPPPHSTSHPGNPTSPVAGRRFGLSWAPGPPWRSRDDRVFGGLAGGVAEWMGVSSVITRAAFAFLIVVTGIGPILYVVAAVVLPVADRSVPEADRRARLPARSHWRSIAVALLVAIAATVLLAAVDSWFRGHLALLATIVVTALALVWSRLDDDRRAFWQLQLARVPGDAESAEAQRIPLPSTGRLLVGTLLLVVGTLWALSGTDPNSVIPVLCAIGITIGGISLITGPWVSALWRDLVEERSERIRSEERSEVAAQLHDSVLQTLALIQRHPETTRPVAQLARQQERSLRAWLFAFEGTDGPDAGHDRFGDGLRAAANGVEDRFGLPVELVVVGDVAADVRTQALVAAAREAMANAAAHSTADQVAVFAEVTDQAVSVFVRDRGTGFRVDEIPPDRQGVRESIVARLARNGGLATVTSAPGEGTEVALELPR